MPLRVHCLMQYLTVEVDKMRPRDFSALAVVKAVKGRDPGGRRTRLNFNNTIYEFGPGQPKGAVDLWLAWAAARLKLIAPLTGNILLVPVPNKTAVVGSDESFPTHQLCTRLSSIVGGRAQVAAELWWDQPLERASNGGPRHADELYPHLVLRRKQVRWPRILIDDVMTSGGHLKACAAKLRQAGIEPIGAICCGRTTHDQVDHPFVMPVEELPDYDPNRPSGFAEIDYEE